MNHRCHYASNNFPFQSLPLNATSSPRDPQGRSLKLTFSHEALEIQQIFAKKIDLVDGFPISFRKLTIFRNISS